MTVKPGAKLSLQKHEHRAEHWVVVSGTARVTRGEEVFDLNANQSTYIPIGVKHRLENRGSEPLRAIEIQSGETTWARTTSCASTTSTGGLSRKGNETLPPAARR